MSIEIFIGVTKKLSEQLGIKKLDSIDIYSPNINMWHAGYQFIKKRKCMLFMHDQTLFSFAMYGIIKKDFENIERLFIENLKKTLLSDEFKVSEIDRLISTNKIEFIKTNNRSVLGSMNDHFRFISYFIEDRDKDVYGNDGQLNMIELNKKLNRIPMQCSKKGFFPIKRMKEILER